MAPTPKHRVIAHPTSKGWTWTQVARNGSAAAVAPSDFDNKANAVRAARRQVDALNAGYPPMETEAAGYPPVLPPTAAVLVVNEHYRRSL